MKKFKIYLASHFFNQGGLEYTEKLSLALENKFGDKVELYVPHRNGDINDKTNHDKIVTEEDICIADERELLSSDMIIGSLDGVEIDAGVAFEFGLAYANNKFSDKKIVTIGHITDMRWNGQGRDQYYINRMVIGGIKLCGEIVVSNPSIDYDFKDILDTVEKYIGVN